MTPSHPYLPILALFLGGLLVGLAILNVPQFLRPKRRTAAKGEPYECGMRPYEETPREVPIPYYVVAMLFLLFDVEVALLYPWIVTLSSQPRAVHAEVFFFLAVLGVGLLYAFRSGAMEWRRHLEGWTWPTSSRD